MNQQHSIIIVGLVVVVHVAIVHVHVPRVIIIVGLTRPIETILLLYFKFTIKSITGINGYSFIPKYSNITTYIV
jgi:hypothetical protein